MKTFAKLDEMLLLYQRGLSNREIAKQLGCHWATIGYQLKKLGLYSNKPKSGPIEMIDSKHARCSKCKKVKALDQFQKHRMGKKYPYMLTYCLKCRRNQLVDSLNSNVENYLVDKFRRLKVRASMGNMSFDLDKQYFIDLFHKQNGKCFYTGHNMDTTAGNGSRPNDMSIDKIIPELGYIKGNIVFCTKRMNTIKNDLSLDELISLMPGIHYKCAQHIQSNFKEDQIIEIWEKYNILCLRMSHFDF